jgi:hypothetical protein
MKRIIGCIGLMGCIGCGAQKTQSQIQNQEQFAALTSVIIAHGKPKPNQAMVTVAIFGGAELGDAKALNMAIKPFLNDELGFSLGNRSTKARPFVVSAPTNAKLPLDIEALAKDAGHHGDLVRKATHVAFVRYTGPALPHHKQISVTLGAAAVVASSPGHVLIDISTRRALDALAWATWVKADSALIDQVVPGVERTKDGVTFFTRGFVKFGLPDLEVFGIMPKEARARFSPFQDAISMLRNGPYVKVGDPLNGIPLVACRRAPEAFESECVRLP